MSVCDSTARRRIYTSCFSSSSTSPPPPLSLFVLAVPLAPGDNGDSMKPIHKRLYTVLPRPPPVASTSTASTSQLVPLSRVRSNSASSARSLTTASYLPFFDAPQGPPPPPTRGGNSNVIVGTRIAAEVRAEVEGHTTHPSSHQQSGHLPYPLALTLGQSEVSPHLPLSPYNPFLPYQVLSPLFVASAKAADAAAAPDPRKKRPRTRYHLDVGAYGIPKRSRGHGTVVGVAGRDGLGRLDVRPELSQEELTRAVQVGEDAYFVRDNAMGVADGVGGWSRHRRAGTYAKFARGLPLESGGADGCRALSSSQLCRSVP